MKRITILIVILSMNFLSYGQIYTHIKKVDKFDDVIWEKEVKTLITFGDSTIIVETKGHQALSYIIIDVITTGSPEEPVNLVGDIWGYEINFIALGENTLKPYILTQRTICTQYTKSYIRQYFWVNDVATDTRTIYYEGW